MKSKSHISTSIQSKPIALAAKSKPLWQNPPIHKAYVPPKEVSLHVWFQFGFPCYVPKTTFKQPLHHSALSLLNSQIGKKAEPEPCYKTLSPISSNGSAKSDTCTSTEESGDQSPVPKNYSLGQVYIEEIIVVEQALYAIEQALKYNQNVAPTCTRWWVVSKIEYAIKIQVI